jgi:signal transduction histidine kinase
MLRYLQTPAGHRWRTFAGSTPWLGSIGLAVVVGIAYFLAARFSLLLLTKPEGVAVFWPAAGVAAGALIALGPTAWLPVSAGAMVATIVAHLLAGDGIDAGIILFALCNAGEALLVAGLVARYFGSPFNVGALRNVLGLLGAAIVATAVSGVGGAVGYVWLRGSAARVLTTWEHWFASDLLGIVTVAPLLIGLAAAVRNPPPRTELIDGGAALATLAVMSGLIVFLPRAPWAYVVAIVLFFPLLLWLAARCSPVFASAAAFIVALTIVWTTTFGIGIFSDANFPMAERILTAQAGILTVSLCAYVLAALFAERRESEAVLVRSNLALQRERENKLMNLEAMAASISHEVRQPLAAIATRAAAARRFLQHTPPNIGEVQSALDAIVVASHRANEIFDSLRDLFGSTEQRREPIDVNEMIQGTLSALREDLDVHGIATHIELTSGLPPVVGHRGQLEEVLFNLARNAIEAMAPIEGGGRMLRVRTEPRGQKAISVAVEDSGPGIDPSRLDGLFEAFVTTKTQGMGLGLAICRMIVARHGGQLTASSDGKHGALFQFVLPIDDAATAASAGRSQ